MRRGRPPDKRQRQKKRTALREALQCTWRCDDPQAAQAIRNTLQAADWMVSSHGVDKLDVDVNTAEIYWIRWTLAR